MCKGVIYIMSTVVSGLVKIGQTQTDQYENRMKNLESNGYANITGLKREFAIEIEDHKAKEKLIHTIFNKSQVGSSELFAIDIDIVIQLLSSFEGNQIYPQNRKKDEVFSDVTKEINNRNGLELIPNGIYYLNRNIKNFGKVEGKMRVKDGELTVLKGSICAKKLNQKVNKARLNANIVDNILQDDIRCDSPTMAANIITAGPNNGWKEWKNENNETIDSFRKKKQVRIN